MSFGVYSFVGGICEKTHKRAKNVQKNKARIPFYISLKEEAHNQANQGLKEWRTRPKSNQITLSL
jgi:ribosomal protein L39E